MPRPRPATPEERGTPDDWRPSERLDERTALVTGGGRGLGSAIAATLAERGARVAIVDRTRGLAESAAERIVAAGGEAIPFAADVGEEEAVEEVAEGLARRGEAVDILVNNAGGGSVRPFLSLSAADWRAEIDLNLTSAFLCIRAFLPAMVDRGWGRIINVGSQLALKGASDQAAYSAAKSGVHGLTRALAREFAGTGVTVNVVAPGPTGTEGFGELPADAQARRLRAVPLGRLAHPAEVAATVALLAGDAGAFYTGATLNLSGGDVID